jgi:hypothetical protein
MDDTQERYAKLADSHGWQATIGLTIMGLPASVWQRGDEIAVYWPAPGGSPADAAVALYDGRMVDDLAVRLAAPAPQRMLSSHIEADKAGLIAYLAALSAERRIQATSTSTVRERRRLSTEADGIDLAVHVLQAWDGLPA